MQAQTFHAAAMRQLRYFWPQAIGSSRWELLDNKFPVVSRAARRAGLDTSTETLRDLSSEIEWAKASLIGVDDYVAEVGKRRRETPFAAEKVAAVYAGYEAAKVSPDGDQLLDFDDLLLVTAGILADNAALAEVFRDRYRCFVVDEYQDVTPAQQSLSRRLARQPRRPHRRRRREPDHLTPSPAPVPATCSISPAASRGALVRLERDYRSTPQVVSLANRAIGAARGRRRGHPAGPRRPATTRAGTGVRRVRRRARRGRRRRQAHQEAPSAGHPGVGDRDPVPRQRAGAGPRGRAHGCGYRLSGACGEAFFQRAEIRQAMRALQSAANRDDLPADAELPTWCGRCWSRWD